MKAKKEYVILALVIVVLSAYLLLHEKGKTHYSLPEPPKIEEQEISRLTITKKGSEIALRREDDTWVILPENYPADGNAVKSMVDSAVGLTLTALASESKNYAVYELAEEKRISVELFSGDTSLRKVDIGKTAPSYHHTFVKIDDDHRVYHASGNLKKTFDKSVSELRDKNVMTIDEDVSEISLKKGKKKIRIVKRSAPASVRPDQKEGEEEPDSKWITDKGDSAKDPEIDEIIGTLKGLKCDGFIEGKTKKDFTAPVYTAALKGQKTYQLSFFEGKDGKYSAVSSGSEYPFLISEWKAKKIMKDPAGLTESKE